MGTSIGIGFSNDSDVNKAVQEAALKSKTSLNESSSDLTIVFSSIDYPPDKVIQILNSLISSKNVIGGSTAGIITNEKVETSGIQITTIQSNDIEFGVSAIESINSKDPVMTGKLLASQCLEGLKHSSRHSMILFIDHRVIHDTSLLNGVQQVCGNVFPIIGGRFTDNFQFKQSYQYFENQILQEAICGFIIGGSAHIGIGVGHGWRPLGKPRFIDKTEGNILNTIDGRPAFCLYQDFFGAEAKNFMSNQFGQMALLYPLGIFMEGSKEYLLRNPIKVLDDGSIVCHGDIPQGAEVHIMIGNKDSCMEAAVDAATEAKRNLLGKDAKLIIIIENMSRLKLLGRETHKEIKKIKDILGQKTPVIGMYSNGEICPFQTIERYKQPHHQNQSIVILAIG